MATGDDTDTKKKELPASLSQLRIAFPSPDESQDVSGKTTCGTCGKEIKAEVYFNRLGPAHRMCMPLA